MISPPAELIDDRYSRPRSWLSSHNYSKLLFTVFFVLFIYVHQDPVRNATSLSRLDLMHAILKEGRFAIDTYHHNTSDVALCNGSYYSDKAPATVALAFPGFALAYFLLQLRQVDLDSPAGWLVSSWLACALSLGLLSAAGACAFFKWLRGWVQPRTALLATCGAFLGAAPLPYSTMMFSHALAVALICIVLWMQRFGWAAVQSKPLAWRDFMTGLCLGSVGAAEFTSVPALAGLFLVFHRYEFRRIVLLLIGVGVPLLLIPLYSLICFGCPLTIGYDYQANFEEMKRGLYGIRLPSLDVALKLLFHPAKGLFVWSPWLLLAFIGFRKLLMLSRRMFWVCLLVPFVQLIIISGYQSDWPAGHNLTPRFLACIIPLLALPAALACERFPRFGMGSVILSITLIASATLLDASPPFDAKGNFLTMYLPLIQHTGYAYNLGQLAGMPGLWSYVPFAYLLALGIVILHKLAPCTTKNVPNNT